MVALSEPPQLDSLAVDYHVSLYPARDLIPGGNAICVGLAERLPGEV